MAAARREKRNNVWFFFFTGIVNISMLMSLTIISR